MACVNLEGVDIFQHIEENLPELTVDYIHQEEGAEVASVSSDVLRSIPSSDDVARGSQLCSPDMSGERYTDIRASRESVRPVSSVSSISDYSQVSQVQNYFKLKRKESLNAIKSLKLRHVKAHVLLEAEKQSIEWDYFQRRAEQQSLVRESECRSMMELTVLQQAMLDSVKDTRGQIKNFWGSSRSFDLDVVSKGYEFLDLPEVFCSEKKKKIWKLRNQIALLVSDMKELKNGIKIMDEILTKVSTCDHEDNISSLNTSPESGLNRQSRPRPNSSSLSSPGSLLMDVDNFSEGGFEERIPTPECVSSENAGRRAMGEGPTANDDQHDDEYAEAAYRGPEFGPILPAQSATADVSTEFIEDVDSCYVLGGSLYYKKKTKYPLKKYDFYCPAQKFCGKNFPLKKDEHSDTKLDEIAFIVECKKRFNTFPEVLDHFREEHPRANSEKLRMCSRCHYMFIGDGNLYCHLMSAHYSGPEFGYKNGEHFKEKVRRYQRMRDCIGNGGGDLTEKAYHRHGHLRYHDLLDIWSTCFLCIRPRQFFENPRDLIKHTNDVHHKLMI